MQTERILTVPQMIYSERQSVQMGTSLGRLMDNAANALARQIIKVCTKMMKKQVVLLIGKGNNGGDGLVAANILYDSGISPAVILCCKAPSTELSSAAFKRLYKKIPVLEFDGSKQSVELISSCGILVDCIFGTGFKGEIRENMYSLFTAVENSQAFKIACDVPSGANAQNGQVSRHTFKADLTVTFHRKKLGLLLSPAMYYCGKIEVCSIDIPDMPNENILEEVIQSRSDDGYFKALLPKRPPWGHKGLFGKIVSVCGCDSYIGAAGISTLAALRTGVGLVNLCTTQAVVQSLSSRILECTYSQMTSSGGFIAAENADEILKKCAGASCLLIGCGLGNTPETQKLTARLAEDSPIPVIIDADGINSLCPNIDVLLKKKSTVILTPHPAELARLCGVTTAEVLSDRQAFASELSRKYGVIVVSKGAQTILCSGKGASLLNVGNTALSKGGSGDMLAGIIASLTAQRPDSPFENAELGCYIMGKTAQMLSDSISQRGILASDIIQALPKFLKQLENSGAEDYLPK